MNARRLARALGWFSLGVGVSELLGARKLTRLLGVSRGHGLIRAYGARELMTGVGLLAKKQKRYWLWVRVAGDVLDLVSLGAGLRQRGANRTRLLTAMGAVAGPTLVDLYAATRA